MSESEQIEKIKVRPWQWPGEWFRDEKFWREVTARALSGVIVLFLGYWAALFLGYIRTPSALRTSYDVSVAAALIIIAISVLDAYAIKGPSKKMTRFVEAPLRWMDRKIYGRNPPRKARWERIIDKALTGYATFMAYLVIIAFWWVFALYVLWALFSLINVIFNLNQPLDHLFARIAHTRP